MTEHDSERRSVTLQRVFEAPIDLVFEAWTQARHVEQWMKCDVKATLELENWVPAVGSEFRTHMVLPGVFDTWGSGRFLEVAPPRLLVYRLDADPELQVPEMEVRVEFRDLDGRTELTLTHSGIPNEQLCGIIDGGWTASLGQLQDLVSQLTQREVPAE
ncbi:MAG: SRPBCC domain-containing protein [Thermoanaerobaculia bacterium]|nr:SRPBCC domain-containing protein [Thermoanaerobaculia bacterium]